MEKGPERPKMFGKIPEAQIRDLEDEIDVIEQELEGLGKFGDEKTREQDNRRKQQLLSIIQAKQKEIEKIRRGTQLQGGPPPENK